MKSFYSLMNEYNSLPSGNIYRKVIYGYEYYYHQYMHNGKMISKKLSSDELKELRIQFERKEILKEEITVLLKKTNRNISLSDTAKEFTGSVLSGDDVVATFDHGILISLDEERCPLIIKRTHSLASFLKTRVIDTSRTNARLLKKALNIKEDDEELISLCSYAVSITDNYWFKPKYSKLNYCDVTFTNDIFFDLSLRGLISIYPHKNVLTPEITTGGSFEKGWKNNDGDWWLYKVGTNNEIFSELFFCKLLEKLHVPTAHYEYEEGFIKSKNFAAPYNYEPIVSIAGSNEDYDYVYNLLTNINADIAKQYLLLMYFDALLNNVDRHNENYGLLRDPQSGKIISLAPNFDNNLSLIARNDELVDSLDGLIKIFVHFLKKNRGIAEILINMIPKIDDNLIQSIIDEIEVKVNSQMVKKYVLDRYNYINLELNKIINIKGKEKADC